MQGEPTELDQVSVCCEGKDRALPRANPLCRERADQDRWRSHQKRLRLMLGMPGGQRGPEAGPKAREPFLHARMLRLAHSPPLHH